MALFQRGQRVEILSKEEGFEGSYFPAVVISHVSGKDYIIQFSTLHQGQIDGYDDEFRPTRQFCKEGEIRPTPPDEIAVSVFSPKDKVDAYCSDGWWLGEILECVENEGVDDEKKKKYVVYFKRNGNKIEMEMNHLRVHQDWSNGKWSIPRKVGRPAGSKGANSHMKLHESEAPI